jgi:FtsH-binding integral membrane protein
MTFNSAAQPYYPSIPRVEVRPLLRNVYAWMTIGMLVTAATAYATVHVDALRKLSETPLIVFGAIIVELGLVVALSAAILRLSVSAATALFVLYAALIGFTLSWILLAYTTGTLTTAFLMAALLFGAMTVVGFTTKADLTKVGTYAFIGLIVIIIASVINIFLRSSAFDFLICIVGVIIFTVLTARDTQSIARMAADPQIDGQGAALLGKLSILGALRLYLDFLNLFLFLVRLLGRRD